MTTIPSPDAKAVVRAVEALTTQVRRIADALTTPVVEDAHVQQTTRDDGPHCVCGDPIKQRGDPAWWIHSPGSDTPCTDPRPASNGPDFTSPIAGNIEVRQPCPWCGDRQMIPSTLFEEHVARLHPDVWIGGPGIPVPAADEDAQRTTRRDSLRNLLDRIDRGVMSRTAPTQEEAYLLRQHAQAEMREADTARDIARSNFRHVKRIVPELEQAQAAIERVQQACHDLPYEHGSRVLAALDGTEQQQED